MGTLATTRSMPPGLRCGSGSLRDRAELLVTLLAAASIAATVHAAPRPASIGLTDLYQLRSTHFAPDPT